MPGARTVEDDRVPAPASLRRQVAGFPSRDAELRGPGIAELELEEGERLRAADEDRAAAVAQAQRLAAANGFHPPVEELDPQAVVAYVLLSRGLEVALGGFVGQHGAGDGRDVAEALAVP